MRLSPREVFQGAFAQQYAFAYFQGANYQLGLEFAQKAHQLRPGHSYPMVIGAACAGHLGDARSAAALVKDLKAALPTISAAWVETTAPYVLAEDRRRLIEGLARAGVFQVSGLDADGSAKPPWQFCEVNRRAVSGRLRKCRFRL